LTALPAWNRTATALATDPSSFTSARNASMPETSRENNERPLSGCREAMRTAKSASCRWRTMRRPRNPVPPNTVTRRQDMSRKYPAALSEAIIFSAFPEAKPVSASRSQKPTGHLDRRIPSLCSALFCKRDRWFESGSLQRGVCCELRSSQARPASRANLTSLDYDLSYISILPPNPEIILDIDGKSSIADDRLPCPSPDSLASLICRHSSLFLRCRR
jgi:hypothetical protein